MFHPTKSHDQSHMVLTHHDHHPAGRQQHLQEQFRNLPGTLRGSIASIASGWMSWTGTPCVFLAGNTEHRAKKRSDTQKLPKVGDVLVLTHNQIIPTTSSGPAAEGYFLCKPIIDTEWKWHNYAKTQVITPSSKTDKLFWFTVSQKQQGLSQTAILTSARVSLSKPSWLVSYGCGYLVGIYHSPSPQVVANKENTTATNRGLPRFWCLETVLSFSYQNRFRTRLQAWTIHRFIPSSPKNWSSTRLTNGKP